MKRLLLTSVCTLLFSSIALASVDTFGTGTNQFSIEFVTISADAGSADGMNTTPFDQGQDGYKTFTDPGRDFRIGKYEISNDQWNKFRAGVGAIVTGHPQDAYDRDPKWTGLDNPGNCISWYEAAQFVNWLNTSTGNHPAYKFTANQGTMGYAFEPWQTGDIGYDPANPYRNSRAAYFLPTDDEWVKAAYFNGSNMQTWATPGDVKPVDDVEANYFGDVQVPWNVGSGSMELNETFDMMGNMWEWTESPWGNQGFNSASGRVARGGSYYSQDYTMTSTELHCYDPAAESYQIGFRVASVPEPAGLVLLSIGGLMLRRRNRK